MKKYIILLIYFLTIALSCDSTDNIQSQLKIPELSQSSKIEQELGLGLISIQYSRPGIKGRNIFGELVPYGKIWRTGANKRTKFTTTTDLKIDGKDLKKGTYGILTVPDKESWDIIFYTDFETDNAPMQLDDQLVALKVNVKVASMEHPVENFTIYFGGFSYIGTGKMYLVWDKTEVSVKIETPTDKIVVANIEKALKASSPSANDYLKSAVYYRNSGKDLNKALEWVSKAFEMNPNAYWTSYQKSLIQADLGDLKGAISTAKVSLSSAEKSNNMNYIKMNQESIAKWSK